MATDRANIRTRARIRADQDASGFPTDTQANLIIDECAKEVFFDLVGAGWPADYSTTNITANGATLYQLNSGNPILGVVAVYAQIGAELFLLKRTPEDRIDSLRSLSAVSAGQPGYYHIRVSSTQGPVVEFLPKPTSGTFRVDHIAEFAGFAADGTVWFGPARSDELIVLKAASKFCKKEGEVADAQALMQEYAELFQKVVGAASWLDMRNQPVIRDVEGMASRDLFKFNVVGPDHDW